jgi:hypothetical protein
VPWAQDVARERRCCGPDFDQLTPAQKTQQLPLCRLELVPEIAAGKTLIAQLATAQPPARWQAEHGEFKQAMQAFDAHDAQRFQAATVKSVSQYETEALRGPEAAVLFCHPISMFNVFLASRSEVLLTFPFPPAACGG